MSKNWYEKPTVLFENWNIVPLTKNTNRNINSLARLAIVLLVIINVFNYSQKYNSIPIIMLIFSFIMKPVEKFHKSRRYKKCTLPTKENPFMNFTVGSHIEDPKREEACNHEDKNVNELITEMFDNKYLNDSYDLFNRKSNERQFVTMPTTQSFSNQDKFRDALYGGFGKCKSEGIDCAKKLDTRHNFRYDQSY